MYTKNIEYVDYNGNKRKEKMYFNLTKAEITEMEYSKQGGLKNFIVRVANEGNTTETFALFKKIVLSSVGVKSDDGKRFIKNDKIREEFEQCPAYDNFLMTLMSNDEELSNFINGIMPYDGTDKAVADAKRQIEDSEYVNIILDDEKSETKETEIVDGKAV